MYFSLVSSFIYFAIGAILYFGRQLTKFKSCIYGITDAKKKHCLGVELILQINKLNVPLMFVSSLDNYLNRNSETLQCHAFFRLMDSINNKKYQTNYPVSR